MRKLRRQTVCYIDTWTACRLTWSATAHMGLSSWCPGFGTELTPWKGEIIPEGDDPRNIVGWEWEIPKRERRGILWTFENGNAYCSVCVVGVGGRERQGFDNKEHNKDSVCVHEDPPEMGLTFCALLRCTMESVIFTCGSFQLPAMLQ